MQFSETADHKIITVTCNGFQCKDKERKETCFLQMNELATTIESRYKTISQFVNKEFPFAFNATNDGR